MASAKAIKKRLRTTKNIRKITKTMELVATAKLKGARQRMRTFEEYEQKLEETLQKVTDPNTQHFLVEPKEEVKHVLVFVISANKGLCGSYNTRIVEAARKMKKQMEEAGKTVEICITGKKGVNGLKFHKVQPEAAYSEFPDSPGMKDIHPLIDDLMERFKRNEIHEVWTIHSHNMRVRENRLIPFACPEGSANDADTYIYQPDRDQILDNLLPLFTKIKVFGMYLQAIVSEQTSRMLAMKSATENADEMSKNLTREYNRARQNQITKEMLEILAGADAIS